MLCRPSAMYYCLVRQGRGIRCSWKYCMLFLTSSMNCSTQMVQASLFLMTCWLIWVQSWLSRVQQVSMAQRWAGLWQQWWISSSCCWSYSSLCLSRQTAFFLQACFLAFSQYAQLQKLELLFITNSNSYSSHPTATTQKRANPQAHPFQSLAFWYLHNGSDWMVWMLLCRVGEMKLQIMLKLNTQQPIHKCKFLLKLQKRSQLATTPDNQEQPQIRPKTAIQTNQLSKTPIFCLTQISTIPHFLSPHSMCNLDSHELLPLACDFWPRKGLLVKVIQDKYQKKYINHELAEMPLRKLQLQEISDPVQYPSSRILLRSVSITLSQHPNSITNLENELCQSLLTPFIFKSNSLRKVRTAFFSVGVLGVLSLLAFCPFQEEYWFLVSFKQVSPAAAKWAFSKSLFLEFFLPLLADLEGADLREGMLRLCACNSRPRDWGVEEVYSWY